MHGKSGLTRDLEADDHPSLLGDHGRCPAKEVLCSIWVIMTVIWLKG